MKTKKVELLAPAGNMEKFFTAIHFGADAVYLSGKSFGLRAFADNFDADQLAFCVKYAHERGKKVYVTVNIFASDSDFDELKDYLAYLQKIGVDAALVSDAGVISFAKKVAPDLPLHLSTQANTLNSYAVDFWHKQGLERVVLARECTIRQIKAICDFNPDCEIEVFVHGAMCVSYSGRCLMSNYLTGRDANRGECVQACRWSWKIEEEGHTDNPFILKQDQRGTYIFNSKDLNLLDKLKEVVESGVASLKIEGRMKSVHYVATIVNAYRRALDAYYANPDKFNVADDLIEETFKTVHREYTHGFTFLDKTIRQSVINGKAECDNDFVAAVKGYQNGKVYVEMRNKFAEGDELEILSPDDSFGKTVKVVGLCDKDLNPIPVAKLVKQIVCFDCPYPLKEYDILRTHKQ